MGSAHHRNTGARQRAEKDAQVSLCVSGFDGDWTGRTERSVFQPDWQPPYQLQNGATLFCESERNPVWQFCKVLRPGDGRKPVQPQLTSGENTNNASVCTSPGYHPHHFCVRKAWGYHSTEENATQAFLNLPFGELSSPAAPGETEKGMAWEETLCGAVPLRRQKEHPGRKLHVCLQEGRKNTGRREEMFS